MSAQAAITSPSPFVALDASHLQIQQKLELLKQLAAKMEAQGLDAADRTRAGDIEAFFSGSSREHHAQEEAHVFPPLLLRGDEALTNAVRSLQQDHGFIEENWIELGPQISGIAEGNDWFDPAEFQHAVSVFVELLEGHIALEETLVYPESKAMYAQTVARRKQR